MKKLLLGVSMAMLALGMIGCNLHPLNQHTLYFYSLSGEGNEDSSITLNYRSDGHTLIMSRGIEGKELTESEATALISQTGFSLTLDTVSLTAITSMSVDELGDSGFHVVQSFSLGVMNKGAHTLLGETDLIQEGDTRTNTVYLTIE